MKRQFGYAEGDVCGRSGCKGIIALHPVENCSCHINPPCGQCTAPRGFCLVCGFEESEDRIENDYVVSENKSTGVYRSWEPRPLDPTKIDYHSKSYTNSAMIKEGACPAGTSIEEVRKQVTGTFGGRFEYFTGTTFKYIAYTD